MKRQQAFGGHRELAMHEITAHMGKLSHPIPKVKNTYGVDDS